MTCRKFVREQFILLNFYSKRFLNTNKLIMFLIEYIFLLF
jgi:hypothetical protein